MSVETLIEIVDPLLRYGVYLTIFGLFGFALFEAKKSLFNH